MLLFTVCVCLLGLTHSQIPPHHLPNSTLNLVRLSNAPEQYNARCLDGTSPTYYHRYGKESGANSFILFFQGGGWCCPHDYTKCDRSCTDRAKSSLGSTKNDKPTYQPTYEGGWSTSADPTYNPRFYNWNIAWLRYCDGSSFTSNMEKPVNNTGMMLHYRGLAILTSILDDLKNTKGMNKATEIIVSGCSAGGLAAYVHCQRIANWAKTSINNNVRVTCWPDAGFFIDTLNVQKYPVIDNLYNGVFTGFNSTAALLPQCIAHYPKEQHKCFFSQHSLLFTDTPVFAWQSGYDSWQMMAEWFTTGYTPCATKECAYYNCTKSLSNCNAKELGQVQGFHDTMLSIAAGKLSNPKTKDGMFLTSCEVHCQSGGFIDGNATLYGGRNPVQAFADWYDNKLTAKTPDKPWPLGNCKRTNTKPHDDYIQASLSHKWYGNDETTD